MISQGISQRENVVNLLSKKEFVILKIKRKEHWTISRTLAKMCIKTNDGHEIQQNFIHSAAEKEVEDKRKRALNVI